MIKLFLSHSSKDKGTVSKVFNSLGAAGVHYDEATFEQGERSAAEIFRALSGTDIFVLFVSKDSVASPWVKTEMALAQQRFYALRIKKILVFIIDDTGADALPEWLCDHVYRKLSGPRPIAEAIRSVRLEMALEAGHEHQFFIGRDHERASLKAALTKSVGRTPSVIFISGVAGVGRRTLARQTLKETYPSLVEISLDPPLADEEGDVDVYKRILDAARNLNVGELTKAVQDFVDVAQDVRASNMAQAVLEVTKQRQVLFLRGYNAIVKDDGSLQDWLKRLILCLPQSAWPHLVIASRRMISYPKRSGIENVAFVPLESLSREDSIVLLGAWLTHLGVSDYSRELLEDVVDTVEGHPTSIEVAARYIEEVGTARIVADRATFNEAMRQRAEALLDVVPLTDDQEKFLALFREYEYLSAEDLLAVVEGRDESIEASLGFLQDHGIIERDGAYLRIAPFLIDAVSRRRWSADVSGFVVNARRHFLKRLETLETGDYIKISAIDQAIVASLRESPDVQHPLLARAMLPSHMLKVAREFYDRRLYDKAAELAHKALGRTSALTEEAQIEALRIRGLALVRRGREKEFYQAISQLERHSSLIAQRNINFLQGFKARWDGQVEQALKYFRKAHKLGGQKNFHILRALAQVLSAIDDFSSAEKFARAAVEIAPRNAYVIDNLVEILIEIHKKDKHYLAADRELTALIQRLKETSKLENRSFYEHRMAHFYSVLGNKDEAIAWAEAAVKVSGGEFLPDIIALANTRLAFGDIQNLYKEIQRVEQSISNSPSGDKRYLSELGKIRVRLFVEEGKFQKAKDTIENTPGLPTAVRNGLTHELAQAIAFGAERGPLTDWANRVLSRR